MSSAPESANFNFHRAARSMSKPAYPAGMTNLPSRKAQAPGWPGSEYSRSRNGQANQAPHRFTAISENLEDDQT